MDAQRVLDSASSWQGLLGAPVPADLLATARARPTMATLVGHVAARILRDPETLS